MKIESIKAFALHARLQEPFAFSQWSYSERETLLVSVETDDGFRGWGEAYGPSRPIKAAVENFFTPLLLGKDPRDNESLWHLMFARSLDYARHGIMLAAISALDIACWDLKAQAAGMPLYRALGAAETESIPCYASSFYFGGKEPPEIAFPRLAARHLEAGFRAAKMKVGFGIERDRKLVELVRKSLGDGVRLMIDANHAYDSTNAIALARQVEPFSIHWFEEPVSPLDIEGYLEVKRCVSIPLAGGECESTRFGFEPLLRRRAVDYAQPDLCACGGITEGLKIAALASTYSIHLTPHVWGSPVGQAAALHFYAARPTHPSSLTPEDKLIECDQSENPLRTEIAAQPVRFAKGRWFLPQTPGLGVEIREAALARFSWT